MNNEKFSICFCWLQDTGTYDQRLKEDIPVVFKDSPQLTTQKQTLVALGSSNTWNELVNRFYSEFPDDKQLDFAAEQIS